VRAPVPAPPEEALPGPDADPGDGVFRHQDHRGAHHHHWPWYTTLIADFADAAIDRGHCHRGRLSFGRSPSLSRVHVRDDRVE